MGCGQLPLYTYIRNFQRLIIRIENDFKLSETDSKEVTLNKISVNIFDLSKSMTTRGLGLSQFSIILTPLCV